jgi:hypothetical protein
VDVGQARWTVEEFFKALKTGCSFEKRQLESLHTLENALALFIIPMAWGLLLRKKAINHERRRGRFAIGDSRSRC